MATAKQPRKSGRSKKVTDAQTETEVPLATGSEVQQFEADGADHGDGNITSQADGNDDRIRQRAYELISRAELRAETRSTIGSRPSDNFTVGQAVATRDWTRRLCSD